MSRKIMKFLLLVVLMAGIGAALLWRERLDAAALEQWVAQAGVWGPLLFMALYALAAVFFVPGSVLTLAGGALFGPVAGTFYNLTGATAGAALAFLVARYLASTWVAQKTGGRLRALIEGVEREGWRFVAFVRLVPLFPFNLLNYALGLTRIRFWSYLLATWICMLPGALAYTWLGYAGREAVAGGEGLVRKGLLALALLAAVAFLPRLVTLWRQGGWLGVEVLKARLDAGDEGLVLDVRGEAEFDGELGHVPGACNIPLEVLADRLAELQGYKEKPVYVMCHTDRRSAKAARLLAGRGFSHVHVVRGGMCDWNVRAYPVERGTSGPVR
ncbi:MAG TPA: sulfurtransferase [Gammaproteobacteria bacterium]|nr:sulfurtransferase [Gammaproteobacteria bacterium]